MYDVQFGMRQAFVMRLFSFRSVLCASLLEEADAQTGSSEILLQMLNFCRRTLSQTDFERFRRPVPRVPHFLCTIVCLSVTYAACLSHSRSANNFACESSPHSHTPSLGDKAQNELVLHKI